jgi:hypothetical protein
MDFNFNLEAFIASISSVIAVVGALFTSLVKLKKTIKQKIAATTENKITSLLQTLTTEAEAFKNFTGAEKKAIVLPKHQNISFHC